MKKYLVISLVLLLALSFSAPVTVTFWHAMSGGHGAALQEIIDMFNSQHPNIVVKGVYIGHYGDLNQKIMAAAAAETLPTMSQLYEDWTSKLISEGFLVPLQKFIDDPAIGLTKSELNDIPEVFIKDNTWKGTIYTMPFNKSTSALFVNTDALDMAGLDIPDTMEQFVDACKDLTIDDDKDGAPEQYGFGLRPNIDTYLVFLRLNGGRVIDPVTKHIYINTRPAIEALQLMHDLVYKNYKTGKDYSEPNHGVAFMQGGYLSGPFGDGKVAMYIGSIAGAPYVDKACKGKHDWALAMLPKWKDRDAAFMGTNLGVFTGATEAQQKAAWEFIKFLIRPDITAYWSMKTGYVPVRISAQKDPKYQQFVNANPDKKKAPLEQIQYGVLDPANLLEWSEIRTIVGNAVRDAMYNKKTPTEALNYAAKQIEQLLKQSEASK